MAEFIQKGDTLNYTASSAAVKAGAVINLTSRIGVAAADIAKGETGAVHVVGVFELPLTDDSIAQGAAVYWDGSGVTATAGENTPAGFVFEVLSADTVAVKIG